MSSYRRPPAHRLVAAEPLLEHALATSEVRQLSLELVQPGRDEPHLEPGEVSSASLGEQLRAEASLTLAVRSAESPIDGAQTVSVDDLILVDFLGPLRLLRAALPVLEPGGVVAGISAVLAEQPMAGMATYSAVKAAASALFRATAKEARQSKIRVLDIRPPHTQTSQAARAIAGVAPKMLEGADPDAVAERIVEAILGNERELPSSAFT